MASPKGLLRLPVSSEAFTVPNGVNHYDCQAASSSTSELAPGTRFRPVLDDPSVADPSKVDRVILLTGKLYYDLVKERQARKLDDQVSLIRIEELAPFPFDELEATLKRYTHAKSVRWVQEEPKNQGAFTHVEPRINSLLLDRLKVGKRVVYRGREEYSVPAPGIGKVYAAQQEKVFRDAFDGL